MARSWQAMLLGAALSWASRHRLVAWMRRGGVNASLLRANLPVGWRIADKSGNGGGTRSLVAMLTPRDRGPYLVAIYMGDTDADLDTRNAAINQIGRAVVGIIEAR